MPLLNVDQAAESLGTSPRFIRRLIAERRIAFTKLGKHVRIDTRDLDASSPQDTSSLGHTVRVVV